MGVPRNRNGETIRMICRVRLYVTLALRPDLPKTVRLAVLGTGSMIERFEPDPKGAEGDYVLTCRIEQADRLTQVTRAVEAVRGAAVRVVHACPVEVSPVAGEGSGRWR